MKKEKKEEEEEEKKKKKKGERAGKGEIGLSKGPNFCPVPNDSRKCSKVPLRT